MILHGTKERTHLTMTSRRKGTHYSSPEGFINKPERRYRRTQSDAMSERKMSSQALPGLLRRG